jgi:hypothetical protein
MSWAAEARAGATPADVVKIRRSSGTRSYDAAHPEVWEFWKRSSSITRGDPESPLRWTCKSTFALSSELFSQHGIRISDMTVGKLLREHESSSEGADANVAAARKLR